MNAPKALEEMDREVTAILLIGAGVDINPQTDDFCIHPLHLAVRYFLGLGVRHHLDRGDLINVFDLESATALPSAAEIRAPR